MASQDKKSQFKFDDKGGQTWAYSMNENKLYVGEKGHFWVSSDQDKQQVLATAHEHLCIVAGLKPDDCIGGAIDKDGNMMHKSNTCGGNELVKNLEKIGQHDMIKAMHNTIETKYEAGEYEKVRSW
jgi:hypothetical protein